MLTICRRPISYSVCLRDSVKRFPNETTKVRVKEKREKLHLPRDPGPRMVSLIFRNSEESFSLSRFSHKFPNFYKNKGSKDCLVRGTLKQAQSFFMFRITGPYSTAARSADPSWTHILK